MTVAKRGTMLTIVYASACAVLAGLLVSRRVGPETRTARNLKMVVIWICNFHDQSGCFPRPPVWAEELLPSLGGILASPKVAEPFFDGWGRPFRYAYPGEHNPAFFDLYSVGPNGVDENGNGDDIGNWKGGGPKLDALWDRLAERGYCSSAESGKKK